MPEGLKNVLSQLLGFWRGLSTAKRWALVTATVGTLALGLGVVLFESHENYSYLFTEMSTEDTAAVVEKLKAQQVPYRLDDSGTRIEVPESRVHELRLSLASQGLPRGGGVGFEIFDKSQLGSTEFEQQVNLRRALEGELSRSISSLRGVQSARVHLVMPERRLFVAGQEKASASVVLKLRSPDAASREEVAGIVHLVASAVPGLSRDRVSVVSADGMTLHRPTLDGESNTGAGDLAEQGQMMGSSLEGRAREQLERVVGPGLADVRVNVTINPATREKTSELYNKDTIALRSEHKVEESTGGNPLPIAGVPGAQSNLPDAKPGATETATTTGGPGGVFRRTQTRNWEVDRVVEKTNTPPGEIQKLSVAVLVDQNRVVKGGKTSVTPRTKEEMAALEDVVKRAVGFDAERGDSLTIQSMAFHRDDMSDATKVTEPPFWRRYIPYALLAFVVVVALFVLTARGKADKKIAAAKRAAELKAAQRAGIALQGAAGGAPVLEPIPPVNLLEAPPVPSIDYRSKALELASKDPATASLVLKGWLSEAAEAAKV
jgi:flagellar M-ring protein FliF